MYDPDYQTFCIYCQEEHGTFDQLKVHLQKEHPGTIAQQCLVPFDKDRTP